MWHYPFPIWSEKCQSRRQWDQHRVAHVLQTFMLTIVTCVLIILLYIQQRAVIFGFVLNEAIRFSFSNATVLSCWKVLVQKKNLPLFILIYRQIFLVAMLDNDQPYGEHFSWLLKISIYSNSDKSSSSREMYIER